MNRQWRVLFAALTLPLSSLGCVGGPSTSGVAPSEDRQPTKSSSAQGKGSSPSVDPSVDPSPVPSVAAVPTVPTVIQDGDRAALKLEWSGPDQGFVAIDRAWPGCDGTCYQNVKWSSTPITEWTDTGVEYGVPYRYKVWNAAGNEGYSAAVTPTTGTSVTPPVTSPPVTSPPDPTTSALPAGEWDLIWADEFNGAAGASPEPHWMTGPAWSSGPRPGDYYWRDAVNSPDECYLDGKGHLTLRTRYVDGERRACYLTTAENGNDASKWTTFGPGATGIYIEYRANVWQMRAFASWFAMWLMSPNNTYDGNPNTGSEIDVMEYVPFENTVYSLMNLFHAAVWWEQPNGHVEPPQNEPFIDAWGQMSAPAYGADLTKDGFHTWGLEWYGDRQRFYFDGQLFWENKVGVSSADNHGLRLTIEIQNGNPYNLWGHAVGAFEDNPPDRLPSYAHVDYVRVFRKR